MLQKGYVIFEIKRNIRADVLDALYAFQKPTTLPCLLGFLKRMALGYAQRHVAIFPT